MSTPMGMAERITHDGLTFEVRDEGPLDGTPVVLLHGFPERSTTWRHVAPILHGRGCRTFAPDQRGYSPGARPRRRRDYRLPLLVDDVAALVAEIGAPVHVVGHDWGGAVGYLLAADCPDLVRTLTVAAVPHNAAFIRAMATSRQGLASWYMVAFQLPRVPELLARRAGGPMERALAGGGMSPHELARFRREIVDAGALPGALSWYRAMPLTRPGSVARRVAVPTSLVWGDGDTAVLRSTVLRTGEWVDADYRFVELPGVSHWIPTQAPEELARVVLDRIAS